MVTLEFTQEGSGYVARYVSWGAAVVQLERAAAGAVSVSANLPGMEAVQIESFDDARQNVIFNAAVPSGVEVTIESATEVTAANML